MEMKCKYCGDEMFIDDNIILARNEFLRRE